MTYEKCVPKTKITDHMNESQAYVNISAVTYTANLCFHATGLAETKQNLITKFVIK
jgi:hypothetical protein